MESAREGESRGDSGPGGPLPETFRFDGFRFEGGAGVLFCDDELVPLPPRSADVLGLLLSRAGEVVSKDEILATAWPDAFVGEDSLTHAISVLRQALGDDARHPKYIQTVPKRGYRLIAVLTEDSPAEGQSAAGAGGVRGRSSGVLVALAVLAAIAVTYWAAGRWGGDTPGAGVPRIEWIGIQEFSAGDEAAALFSTRLRQALRDEVESRTGLPAVLGSPGSGWPEGVGAVLSAEVRVNDGFFEIVARARTPVDDDVWWHHELRVPIDGSERSAQTATSMVTRLRFLLDHSSVLSPFEPPASPEALKLAVHAANLMLGPAQQDLTVARDAAAALGRAAELDPGFARARATRVGTLVEAAGWRELTAAEIDLADRDLDRAVRDAADDPVVHVAVALRALMAGDPAAALAALDRADALGADMFWSYMVRADVEMRLGAFEVALATVRRGLELDPLLPALRGREIDVLLAMDDVEAARQAVGELEALDPDGYWPGRARVRLLWREGRLDEAEHELRALRTRWANLPWVHLLAVEFADATGREALGDESRDALRVLQR